MEIWYIVVIAFLLFILIVIYRDNIELQNKLIQLQKVEKDKSELRRKIFEKEYEKIYGKLNIHDVIYNEKD